jgi:hypothetical protein
VLHGLERLDRCPRHPLGGTVGRDQVGELALQRPELAGQRVVLGVGGFRPRLDVVQIVVVTDLLAQLHDALGGVGAGHTGQSIIAPTAAPGGWRR